MRHWTKWVQVGLIATLFLAFKLLFKYDRESELQTATIYRRLPRVKREFNSDASLSIPFLDKVNDYWLVKGETQIRNYGNIRLTSRGQPGQYGIVVSNGAGDNTLDDFETVVSFKIHSGGSTSQLLGDGMVIMITPEKDFVSYNMLSSYARQQFELNSGGILGNDRELMGLPQNLPGLAVIIDTYRNDAKTRLKPPFLSVLLNMNPQEHHYSFNTDGKGSTGYQLCPFIKLKKSTISGKETKLRIIYLESIGFLKIDIKYSGSDEWIELYQQDTNLYLPKNKKSGQRYIAIGAMTGQLTETVEIQQVETSEFHWDEGTEDDFDYVEEMQYFLAHEYGEYVDMEIDDYSKWKNAKSRGEFQQSPPVKLQKQHSKIYAFFKFAFIITLFYGLSLSVRVSMKRARRLRNRKRKDSILG